MTEPFIIEPTVMKCIGDCCLCCLRMITGKSFAEVLGAVPRRARRSVMVEGLTVMQICNMAKKLGCPLEYHDDDFNPDYIGILVLDRAENDDSHMVVWLGQSLYNPADGLIYTDLETYLKKTQYRVEGFLFRRTL